VPGSIPATLQPSRRGIGRAVGWFLGMGAPIPVLLVCIIGVAFSLYAFTARRAFDLVTAETNFKLAATARVADLRRSIAKPFDGMLNVEMLMESVNSVDQAAFNQFAGEVLVDNPEIQQLIWAPVDAPRSGAPLHSPAPPSLSRFKASYVLPSSANALVGRDLDSLPGYSTCLNKPAAATADTDRICFLPVDRGVEVLVILGAVRATSHGNDSDMVSLGAVAGRFNFPLTTDLTGGAAFEIFDLATPAATKLLHPGEHPEVTAYSIAAAGGTYRDVRLGSETWRVAVFPATRKTPTSGVSLVVLAGCLGMTANLAGYILLTLRRRRKIEATVLERTGALQMALGGLRRSEQRLQDYAATASDWYWETSADLHFTRVAAHAREHKIEPSSLIGLDRLTEDDAEIEVVQRREVLGRHQMFRDLRYDYATERDLLTLSLSGMPIFSTTGIFVGYRGSARDITLQLQVEAKLRLARWVAEQASRAKSTFLATMSHEIRTPMNGVLGMVQLLGDTALDHEQRRMCDVIYQSGNSLKQILNDILDYSKLEAGKITLELIDSSLIDIVESVVSLMRGTAEEKGLTIKIDAGKIDAGDTIPPPVRVDPTRFRQVLVNLVSNAIKFSERGVVTIRLRTVPVGSDQLAITLAVADQGIGVSPEAQRRLFTRFSQADTSTTRRFGGTGLGLAITRELVTLMGGTINVHSIPGHGSTFTVQATLPIAMAGTGPMASQYQVGQSADAKLLDILVAEDEAINQEVIRGLLRGHRITMVGDGCDAVLAVQTARFDVVLMDVMMPIMDGMTATETIRALASPAAAVPIIALTANSMSGDRERYLAVGMSGYVSKPIERHNLFEVIEQVIGATVWRPVAAERVPRPQPAATSTAVQEVEDFMASLEG
jgi:signal transduction histidine kinase/CheY-like chemotaxis protein